MAGAPARAGDGGVPARRRTTCSCATTIIESGLDIPHRQHARRSSAPTCSASRSCTRSAAASAARDVAGPRLPLLPRRPRAVRGGARAPGRARRLHGARLGLPHRACATSSCAAPATCSATSSRATSPRSASSSTASCWPRRWRSCRAARGASSSGPFASTPQVDAYVPSPTTSAWRAPRWTCTAASRWPARRRAARPRGRAGRPLRRRCPSRSRTWCSLQEARLELPDAGLDYLAVKRTEGRPIGRVVALGPRGTCAALRDGSRGRDVRLGQRRDRHRGSPKARGLEAAMELVDGIVATRRAALGRFSLLRRHNSDDWKGRSRAYPCSPRSRRAAIAASLIVLLAAGLYGAAAATTRAARREVPAGSVALVGVPGRHAGRARPADDAGPGEVQDPGPRFPKTGTTEYTDLQSQALQYLVNQTSSRRGRRGARRRRQQGRHRQGLEDLASRSRRPPTARATTRRSTRTC